MTAPSTAADFAPPALRSLPLERKLPLLIFGVLAVVLAASLGLSYYEVRRNAEIAAADRVSSLTPQLAAMMQLQVTARVNALKRAAASPAVEAALLTPGRALGPEVEQALQAVRTLADSSTPPRLLTRDGRALGGIALEQPDDSRYVREDVQSLAESSDSARVGRLFASGGHASYWITVPVRQSGTLVGFVAQERRIVGNPRTIRPLRDLVGNDINMYVRNVDDPFWVEVTGGIPVAAPKLTSRFNKDVEVYSHGSSGRGLASSAAILGTPMIVTLESPMSAILARPLATMRTLAVLAIILAVLAAAIAWAMGRRLTRPLVDLTAAVEAMAQGHYSERVAAERKDEFGRLALAFNRMAERVQVSSEASIEAVDRLTKAAARQQFLAEASQILAASLSDQTLLAGLGRLCVPTLADYSTIHVADDDGNIRRMETVHYDPAKEALVRSLVRRFEYRVDDSSEVATVMRTRQPRLISRLDFAEIKKAAHDDETAKLLDEVRPTSFMCVPLVGRGRAFGAMSFTMTDSGRTFRQDDVDLAMELARRTAVAIDNAVIYRSSIALRLEAEAASNAKSDFLAKMSHEIRTPINAMMGYAELLEMGISGPINEAQAKQLARIRASGEHLTGLVDEILDLAKIESGRMDVTATAGVSGAAVESAIGLIRPAAAVKGVELSSAVEGNPNALYVGDPQRVQQILTNLLANAIKFTPAGGRVSVACGGGPPPGLQHDNGYGWTSIAVQDTGVGIAADDLERIFHPFVQVDSGYTRAHGGTGLGLTISRSLAQMMGGDISVESVPQRGSRFTLWLPAPTTARAREHGSVIANAM